MTSKAKKGWTLTGTAVSLLVAAVVLLDQVLGLGMFEPDTAGIIIISSIVGAGATGSGYVVQLKNGNGERKAREERVDEGVKQIRKMLEKKDAEE
jgi:hypothetical protein